jgi:hypothetical protein
VCVCVCACVRACVCVCMRARVRVRMVDYGLLYKVVATSMSPRTPRTIISPPRSA